MSAFTGGGAAAGRAGRRRPSTRALFGRVACAFGLHHLARTANRRKLLIVCYHGVSGDGPDEPTHWLLMPQARFRQQIAYLARHYRCVPIDQGLRELDAGELQAPTACVTFDDGYRNNRTYALPILEEYGVPATIYLPTGLVGTGDLLWTTRVELAFARSPAREVDLRDLGLGVRALGGEASRAEVAKAVCEALKTLTAAKRRQKVAELHVALAGVGAVTATAGVPSGGTAFGDPDADGSADHGEVDLGEVRAFEIMTWDEIRTMEATGLITFGAHTVHHELVSRLDDDELKAEIGGSVRTVAEHVRMPTRTFAYPNGQRQDYDERAKAVLRSAGMVGAGTTLDGLNGRDVDRFELARITLGGHAAFDEFRLRTSGALLALSGRSRRAW